VRRVVSPQISYSRFVCLRAFTDNTRRSSAGSLTSAATPSSTSPMPAFRADMFRSLRPMASTESLNFSMNSKRTSVSMWRYAGTRMQPLP
jgi:hypothetical protein